MTYLNNLAERGNGDVVPSDPNEIQYGPGVTGHMSTIRDDDRQSDTRIPLVSGNANGDRIMSMSLHNHDRTLGIVHDKGLCIYKKIYTPNHDYVLHVS